MNRAGQFVGQDRIDLALAIDAGGATKSLRCHDDGEMRGACSGRSGVARMAMGIIFDHQCRRVESRTQLAFHLAFHIRHHSFNSLSQVGRPWFLSGAFVIPIVGSLRRFDNDRTGMGRTATKDPRDHATAPRLCAHPECLEEGQHPAPKSRDRLRDYFWFCKQHAREYNAAWDYCRGMGQADIDRIIRQDTVWGRPTWPLGMQRMAGQGGEFKMKDGTGFFSEEDDRASEPPPDDTPIGTELWAMRALDLSPPLTLTGLKARYKELAKRLHPDVNGGDSEAEERLKRINLAYATLRANFTSRAGTT